MATPREITQAGFLNSLFNNGNSSSSFTGGADTSQLDELFAFLTQRATAGGSKELIKDVFRTGNIKGMPAIVHNVQAGGARGGTSSYQALATGNLQAALAGEAEQGIMDTLKTAAQVAAAKADATKTTTTTSGSESDDPLATLLGLGSIFIG